MIEARWRSVKRDSDAPPLPELTIPARGEPLAELKERMLTFFLETSDIVPHEPDRRG
jgi:hypothetical protein